MSGPGLLCSVPLTWIPTFGIVYVASPRSDVRYGVTTRQYGFVTDELIVVTMLAGMELVAPLAPDPSSGIVARTAQLSARLRPLLVPPCTVSPFRSRAETPTSTPCQFSVWATRP